MQRARARDDECDDAMGGEPVIQEYDKDEKKYATTCYKAKRERNGIRKSPGDDQREIKAR